jgi:hypothetical protein
MKKVNPNNPFLIGGYISPKYFCDREIETSKIISALENERNISLISPRRYGKTGLIHHAFYTIKEQKSDIICIYLDIFSTKNLHDFVQLVAKNVLGQLDNNVEKAIKHFARFFQSFRPTLSYNSITGQPELSISIEHDKTESSLQEIFAYLQQSEKRCYIAIDEFQQITEYPEKGVEALLRSYMQDLHNVKFIFAGSKKHLMDAMFSFVNRPFYQSTQKINIWEIPSNTYCEFAQNIFAANKRNLPTEVFDCIYRMMLGHTWYIQFILNHLFSLKQKDISIIDVNKIIADVLKEENAIYKTYCELLTKGQLRLLTAVAKETKLSSPLSASVMKKYDLTAASSVKLAFKSLEDKTLLLKNEDGHYFVYDRFFSLWLKGY